VVRVLTEDRIIVSGINMIKKHQKPNPQAGVAGGIVEKEASIHASNVAIYNSATKKADRIGFKVLENGDKVRVFKSNGEALGA
jgi:large subunit ribosomal protein L24